MRSHSLEFVSRCINITRTIALVTQLVDYSFVLIKLSTNAFYLENITWKDLLIIL